MHMEPVYVHVISNSQGHTISATTTGKMVKILWGGCSAGHYYITELFSFLLIHGYTQSNTDSFLLYDHGTTGTILIAVKLDDFLIVASHRSLIGKFFITLSMKYAVKRLGRPTLLLGWTFNYLNDGIKIIIQPLLFIATISNSGTATIIGF